MARPLRPPARPRPEIDPVACEQQINRLRAVLASRIILNIAGAIDEIHVLADRSRPPKALVRDIVSLLLVSYGLHLDYRKISLVQPDAEQRFWAAVRPRLQAVTCGGGQAEVTLEVHGRLVRGEAWGGDDPADLAALATLEALKQIAGDAVAGRLIETSSVPMRPHPVLLVSLELFGTDQESHLIGISFLRDSVAEAAARAVLNALNRRLAGSPNGL